MTPQSYTDMSLPMKLQMAGAKTVQAQQQKRMSRRVSSCPHPDLDPSPHRASLSFLHSHQPSAGCCSVSPHPSGPSVLTLATHSVTYPTPSRPFCGPPSSLLRGLKGEGGDVKRDNRSGGGGLGSPAPARKRAGLFHRGSGRGPRHGEGRACPSGTLSH